MIKCTGTNCSYGLNICCVSCREEFCPSECEDIGECKLQLIIDHDNNCPNCGEIDTKLEPNETIKVCIRCGIARP